MLNIAKNYLLLTGTTLVFSILDLFSHIFATAKLQDESDIFYLHMIGAGIIHKP